MAASTKEDFFPYDVQWRRQPLGYGFLGCRALLTEPVQRYFLTSCWAVRFVRTLTPGHCSTNLSRVNLTNPVRTYSPKPKYAVLMNTAYLLSSTLTNYIKKQNTSDKSHDILVAFESTMIRWLGLLLLKPGWGSILDRATVSCATLYNVSLYPPHYMASYFMAVILTM